jgi:predicted hotdog family 3-hydroxylacyl-ACP dehydratase
MDRTVWAPETLIPHRGEALLLRQILRHEGETIECVGVIPGSSPFVQGGRAPSFVGLELAAQAAAALQVLERSDRPLAPPHGYLVGVREARFTSAWIPADREIHTRVRRTGQAGPLTVHDVLVEVAGSECVAGVISTYAR